MMRREKYHSTISVMIWVNLGLELGGWVQDFATEVFSTFVCFRYLCASEITFECGVLCQVHQWGMNAVINLAFLKKRWRHCSEVLTKRWRQRYKFWIKISNIDHDSYCRTIRTYPLMCHDGPHNFSQQILVLFFTFVEKHSVCTAPVYLNN